MRNITDPIEMIVAEALDTADIAYRHESDDKGSASVLDFELENGVMIECKQFSTPRTSAQIEDVSDVIVIQGRKAAEWFAEMIKASG